MNIAEAIMALSIRGGNKGGSMRGSHSVKDRDRDRDRLFAFDDIDNEGGDHEVSQSVSECVSE